MDNGETRNHCFDHQFGFPIQRSFETSTCGLGEEEEVEAARRNRYQNPHSSKLGCRLGGIPLLLLDIHLGHATIDAIEDVTRTIDYVSGLVCTQSKAGPGAEKNALGLETLTGTAGRIDGAGEG